MRVDERLDVSRQIEIERGADLPRFGAVARRAARDSAKSREIRTTLDLDLQRDVEALVHTHAARLAQRGATTAAVVVVDNATGDVVAQVGSADWGDASISG